LLERAFLLFAKAFLAVAPFVSFLANHREPLKFFCWLLIFSILVSQIVRKHNSI
jgi:hypothetical protein